MCVCVCVCYVICCLGKNRSLPTLFSNDSHTCLFFFRSVKVKGITFI